MYGTLPPLPQYAFMAWCSVKKKEGQEQLYLYFIYPYPTVALTTTNPNMNYIGIEPRPPSYKAGV
jgi:hypothetical protein